MKLTPSAAVLRRRALTADRRGRMNADEHSVAVHALVARGGEIALPEGRSGQQQRCEYHKHDCEELHGSPLSSRLICGVRLYPNSSRISLLFKRHEPRARAAQTARAVGSRFAGLLTPAE